MTAATFPWATRRVKSSNEILVYLNMGVGLIKDTALFSVLNGVMRATDNPHFGIGNLCCGRSCVCPDNSWDATVIQNKNTVAVGGLPVNSPLFAAIPDVIDPAGEGDIVNHVCLPTIEDDVLICHDQGASAQPGIVFQSIARKFNTIDHRIRQRPENSLTLQNLFVSSWVGLQRFMGVPCTAIIRVNPDGVGTFQEVHYYCDLVLTPVPMDSGEGNDPINISMSGDYSFAAIFANQAFDPLA